LSRCQNSHHHKGEKKGVMKGKGKEMKRKEKKSRKEEIERGKTP
jgi:hypothetical protein